MFKTKLEKETEKQKYSPDFIKAQAISGMKLLPEDGEQFDFRSGLGNKIIKQVRNDEGKFYERSNPDEEWKPYDISEMLERIKRL